jgi:Helix-turn-helix domain
MKATLLALAWRAHDDGRCHRSIATIAFESGQSERSVQRALRALVKAGIISVDAGVGRGSLNTYNLQMGAITAPFIDGKGVSVTPIRNPERVPNRSERVPNPHEKGANVAPSKTRDKTRVKQESARDPERGLLIEPAQVRPQPAAAPPPSAPQQQARAPRAKRQFPDDWRPDAKGVAFAIERGVTDIAEQVARCREWHQINAKETASPAASWQWWCSQDEKFRQRDAARAGPRSAQTSSRPGKLDWLFDDLVGATPPDVEQPPPIEGGVL